MEPPAGDSMATTASFTPYFEVLSALDTGCVEAGLERLFDAIVLIGLIVLALFALGAFDRLLLRYSLGLI